MATQKQLAANRRNAEKSTGPRSVEGKAVSSRNALKTGLYCRGVIIGKENPQQLDDLEAAFSAEYTPATPTERSLVDSLIHLEWMLRRYRWLETETWYATLDELPSEQRESTWTGHGFIHQPAISRIHRLRTATQRSFHETLTKLRSLQAERAAAPPVEIPETVAAAEGQLADSTTPDSEIGFVSPNPRESPNPLPVDPAPPDDVCCAVEQYGIYSPKTTREDSPCS